MQLDDIIGLAMCPGGGYSVHKGLQWKPKFDRGASSGHRRNWGFNVAVGQLSAPNMPAPTTAPAAALAPDASSTSAAGQATADLSGALAWASAVPQPAGRMRAWLDVEPVDGRPESMLWTASLVLLRHLETEHPAAYWRGKRVLELGAGMGHLAVGLARLGAQVTATEAGYSGLGVLQAWSTHLLKERAGGGEASGDGALSAGCDAHGGTVSTQELWWGARDGLSESFEEGFDVIILDDLTLSPDPTLTTGPNPDPDLDPNPNQVIILSELVYDEDLHEELLQTLGRALRPGAVAYSGFCDR